MMARLLTVGTAGLGIASALADAPARAEERDWRGTLLVGPAIDVGSNPYAGTDDAEVSFLPLFHYENGFVEASLEGLGVKIVERPGWRFQVIAQPRFAPFDSDDSDALDGIERDVTLDLGARLTIGPEHFHLEAVFRQEVKGEHDGQEVEASLNRRFDLGKTEITLAAGALWQSKDLGNYLYGVDADEALADRSAYEADDAITPFAAIDVVRQITGRWLAFAQLRATFLPNAATDSPIVEDDAALSSAIGVAYVF